MSLFLKGIYVGLSVAVPVGPVALLCMRQTLSYGISAGFVSGFAASLSDALYALAVVWSAQFFQSFISSHEGVFYTAGSVILWCVGWSIFRSPSISLRQRGDSGSIKRGFVRTLLLNFASPMTTLLFIALFASYGVFEALHSCIHPGWLIGGVFMGAMIWWSVVALILGLLRDKLPSVFFMYINRLSGLGILGFSLFTLGRGVLVMWG